MHLSETYSNRLKELAGIKNNGIICFHRSNEFEHMENGSFSTAKNDAIALFGPAIYFAQSHSISQQLGKYICKFSIQLKTPVLDMNKEVSNDYANQLLVKFNEMFKTDIVFDFNNEYDNVQYGEFFVEIAEAYNWDYNIYFPTFIKSLGFNSFKYFCNYHTDFINEKGDYGLSYGIYDPSDIKFLDGPF